MGIVEFLCWCIVVAMVAAWMLTLADKWGWREWLQVHAPTDFLYSLFSCNFCCSWWVCVIISIILSLAIGRWEMLVAPMISTMITRKFYENR